MQKSIPRRFGQVQALLDLLATCAIVGLAGTMIWTSLSRKPAQPPARAANRPQVQVPKELVSIRGAQTLGNPAAPLAMIVFSDFQCPFCAQFALKTMPDLQREYVATGKLLIAFRNLPLTGLHGFALSAALTAECAGRQRFWRMHDVLFANQKRIDERFLEESAREIGLDSSELQRCRETQGRQRITQDEQAAQQFGIQGTPTFFLGSLQGDSVRVMNVLTGMQTTEQIDSLLSELRVARTER